MQEIFIDIKSLDADARGVGHLENEDGSPGKVIFVEGALPGERVSFETLRKKKNPRRYRPLWWPGSMRTGFATSRLLQQSSTSWDTKNSRQVSLPTFIYKTLQKISRINI